MGKILFDEQPIVVGKELAKVIGLNEALVLQQVHYWLQANAQAGKNYFDGRYWTYNSIADWTNEFFPWWSVDTVRRIFATLVKQGILITANYNKEKRDRTLWYSIDEQRLEELMGSDKLCNTDKEKEKIDEETRHKCKYANCINASMQNAKMHLGNLHTPLPENTTKNTTENNSIKNISLSSPPSQQMEDLIERYAAQMEANAFAVSEQRMIKSIMRILAETLTAGQAIKAGGRVIQQEEIEAVVNQMGKKELQYVLDVLNSNTKPVKSIKNYILTIILNLPTNMPLFYQGGKLPPKTVKPPGTSFNNFASRDYTDIDLTGLMQVPAVGGSDEESAIAMKGG